MELLPSEVKKGRKLCSRKCKGKWDSENYRGEKNHSWKGGNVSRVCKVCGKEFKVKKNEVKKGYGKFCSQKCTGKWRSESFSGENSPNWKGGKVSRFCKVCGKKFKVKQEKVKKGYGKFCSHKCARKAIQIPTHHTKPEKRFMEICDKHNLPFKYTGDSSFWIKNINPDFVECNNKKIAVEVFGDYWHSPLLNPKLREKSTLPYRQKVLKKYGWKLIVFWETDLKRQDAEDFVLIALRKEGIRGQ